MNQKKTIDDLLIYIGDYFDTSDLEEIKQAYLFIWEKTKGVKKEDGQDYITHPLQVAFILSDLHVDKTTLMAALLHGSLNMGIPLEELKENFSHDVVSIVENITQINKLEISDKNNSATYLRNVLVGLSEDVRVLFVKLADRLDSMRTTWKVHPEHHTKKVEETMQVLIPIAHRLGINSIKSELEDLCLEYMHPDIYHDIEERLSASSKELQSILNSMQEEIEEILMEQGIKFHIKSRVKSIYSIYKKLEKGKKWKDIYDILALRIIVEKISECYLSIGLIHSKYRPIPKRFKDYIAMPKENMYQSLHTGVVGLDGHIFEIQVRTEEMDEIAEKGIASHWSYKEKGSKKIQNIMEQKLEFFRNVIETYQESESDIALSARDELLSDTIYVYTPTGDVVELPIGATPIDFAYRIHSKVGDTTIGALVNDEIVPLSYTLKDGDTVKINTSKNSSPSESWLGFVKTNSAKSKIRAYFSKIERENYMEKGKTILEKELRHQHLSFSEVFTLEKQQLILQTLKLNDFSEAYLNLGALRYTANYIIRLALENSIDVADALLERIAKRKNIKADNKKDIVIDDYNDLFVTKAMCCKPVKGDDIVGYITKGNGISIHKSDCPNILDKKNRLVHASWNMDSDTTYLKEIKIESVSDKNYIADIISISTMKKINVTNINTKMKQSSLTYHLSILVKNKEELQDFINRLEDFKDFKKVEVM